VLNAIIATEPSSTVMQSVLAAIEKYYAAPANSAYKPQGSFMGTTTMRLGLTDVVSRDCPGMDITNLTSLQRACGSHHNFRFYQEAQINCRGSNVGSAECPISRSHDSFAGAQFGLFEPGPARNLVAWSRFESCKHWGCEERTAESSPLGACPLAHPHPVAHAPVVKGTYSQVKTAGQCCRGDNISVSGNNYARYPVTCEHLCDSNPACLYFDHSKEWENCVLCADCDDGNSDQKAYGLFTAWAKPTPGSTPAAATTPAAPPTPATAATKVSRCSTKFGINFCNSWCNTPGYWPCGTSVLAGPDVRNTDDVDYTCSCSGCNGCPSEPTA